MSAGTRKKIVDFHKILFDGISNDMLEENYNSKSHKKTPDKYKSKTTKETKKFLGMKRKEKLTKKLKLKQGEPGLSKDYPSRKIKYIKKSKIAKIENSQEYNFPHENEASNGNINAVDNNKITYHSFVQNQMRRVKLLKENAKLTKHDYHRILTENIDEYSSLGINSSELAQKATKGEQKSINSDLTSLTLDLFSCTKFENSKPFKMIDYILNSDSRYLTSHIDKDTYEDLKKTIYNKKDSSGTLQTIYKSLYQYFKTDFSFSYIYKIFDSCNDLIQNSYYDTSSEHQNPANDKKDKFTYQSYLIDKLKSKTDLEFFKEINDKEMVKSLIYLINKHLKHSTKLPETKQDLEFSQLLVNNLSYFNTQEEYFDTCANSVNEPFINTVRNKVMENKKFIHKTKKKLRRLFSFKEFCDFKEYKNLNKEKVFGKLLESFLVLREDDYEKVFQKLKKFEKENDPEDKGFRNVKAFWVKFKIIFYLVCLNTEEAHYITDELFWKIISEYVKLNREQLLPMLKPLGAKRLSHKKMYILINFRLKKVCEKSEEDSESFLVKAVESTHPNKIFNTQSDAKRRMEPEPMINGETQAIEFIRVEFYKNIINKIANKEEIFEIRKERTEGEKVKRKRSKKIKNEIESDFDPEKTSSILSLHDDSNKEDKVIKPKTVRVKPGFNPAGNIIINNYYNIFGPNLTENSKLTILNKINSVDSNYVIIDKEKKKSDKIYKKKGRPNKKQATEAEQHQ